MMIKSEIIHKITNIQTPYSFNCLGLSNTMVEGSLSFLDQEKFINDISKNNCITGVIVSEEFSDDLRLKNKVILISNDPRYDYYSLYNYFAKLNFKKEKNEIDDTVEIHSSAVIATYNVRIGKNTTIGPCVVIYPDVEIGDNCNIGAGAVIGKSGFEHKRTSKGILTVIHDGNVKIGNNVDVGSNTCIDKGFRERNTIIGNYTKIDNLVHVGHCVTIGNGCFITATSMIGGSSIIKDNVWIGPNSCLTNFITVHDEAIISMSSVVTKDVPERTRVTGFFAIDHKLFLENFKKKLKSKD